ncbi:MAG: hypothetical protein PVF27_05220 [Gemmatimonadales bacterium]|jgi:hypothetical protein
MPDDHRTPVTYSKEEARQIRAAVRDESTPLNCPRCGRPLTVGAPVAGGGTMDLVWEVHCATCRRSVLVADVPPNRRPAPPGT